MEKILVAMDAINYDKNVVEFACYLAMLMQSDLTAIFLENQFAEKRRVFTETYGSSNADDDLVYLPGDVKSKLLMIEKNIAYFKQACLIRGIDGKVHRDRGVPEAELIKESRFAELVVVSPDTSFDKDYKGSPSNFIKDILLKAECPVILAPQNFDSINEIVLTYDGTASSVFAIKLFTYLFPSFRNKPTSVILVVEHRTLQDTDLHRLKEWLHTHYSNLQFEMMVGKSDLGLFESLFKKKNIFIVMGAYGRGLLSRFLRRSHADIIIKTINQPIFITHF